MWWWAAVAVLVAPYAVRPVVDVVAEAGGTLRVTASHPDGVDAVRLWVNDAWVAEAEGDALAWTVEGEPGEIVSIYAEATAASVERLVPDWPIPAVTPRPGVVGWMEGERSLLPPEPASMPASDPAEGTAGGCACDAGGRGSIGLWLVAVVLAAGRRRR
jgi:MYXO-CTERM domain-containing protein